MRKTAVLFFALYAGILMAQASDSYQGRVEEVLKRTAWHRDARFGMFIHWGAYAVPARGEWVKSAEKMTNEDYQKYVEAFVPSNYNPKEWAELAKKAGMKYAVMTAKHHDGLCLYDSKLTDYKTSNYNAGRDFIKEYVEAFRAEGLNVGLYYSLIDWHHKDYPNVGNHPMAGNPGWDKKKYNWDNYITYMHGQIEELMTNYGKIDVLWLDFSFDEYRGEKWKAEELVNMIRRHQPEIILNNRLGGHAGMSKEARNISGYGDFDTPEQGIPDKPLVDAYGNPIPWETCLTLNNNWGYSSTDNQWKSPDLIIHSLVNCVSKDGNLLLNIGPDAQGTIPWQSIDILTQVGEWMDVHSESIYGCGQAEIAPPEWGYFTQNGNTVYAHWTYPKVGHLNVPALSGRAEKVTVLTTGKAAVTTETWWGNKDEGNFFINLQDPTYMTYIRPNEVNTVFKIMLLTK